MCDEGDIEDDLPPLSANDPIARVGFLSLALVCTAPDGDHALDEKTRTVVGRSEPNFHLSWVTVT